MNRTVHVPLGERSYDVHIGSGMLPRAGQAVADLGKVSQVVVIADATVAGLFAEKLIASIRPCVPHTSLLTFPAGEKSKSLAVAGKLFDDLFALDPAVDRNSVVVALGGGVTGDLAGFVAACCLRGLRWLQCPTTLLADVDSSVGGKTAVDHVAGKNLIGAFHQPKAVLIDVALLATLPVDQVRSGLAECVKHGVIRRPELLDEIETAADALLTCDEAAMTDLVAGNVEIKAAVVAADETESGQREHLNFGHTIGHAIETIAGYDRMSHGQAVALGIIAEMRLAADRGLIERAYADRVEALLARLGLETACDGLDADAVWRIMLHDKKARAGKVRIILPTAPGEVSAFDDITPAQVGQALKALETNS